MSQLAIDPTSKNVSHKMSADDIARTLNEAINMLIKDRLANAKFDSTVEGTVLEVKDKDNGVYLVLIQSAKFEAYSAQGVYYAGEQVYIQVPRNDYTQLKFIVGRKVDGDTDLTEFRFRYPFDDFIALFDFTREGTFFNHSELHRANDPEDGAELQKSGSGYAPIVHEAAPQNNPDAVFQWVREEGRELFGTTLGLQCNVLTYLGEYNPISGNYGYRIMVTGDIEREDKHIDTDITTAYYFTSSDMYGNPYSYYDETTQLVLIDVSEYHRLNKIVIYFWQDHNFYDEHTERIPYMDVMNPSQKCEPNIILTSLTIGFGYRTGDIDKEKLYLYTYDKTTYGEDANSNTPREELDTRTLNFAWIHKLDDESLMLINSEELLLKFNEEFIKPDYEGLPNNEENYYRKRAHVYWYHQQRDEDPMINGEPYVEDGTSIAEIRQLKADLIARRDSLLADAESNKDNYISQENYEAYVASVTLKYNLLIDKLTEVINNYSNIAGLDNIRILSLAGQSYHLLPEGTDKFSLTYLMNYNLIRERFKVAVVWDYKYYVSEPFEFTNVNLGIEEDILDGKNEVIFKLLREERYKEGNNYKTRLIEDNALSNFLVYDENDRVTKNAEGRFWSDVWFYILIWIYNHEIEDYVPLYSTDDEPVTITWGLPLGRSMLELIGLIDLTDMEKFRNALMSVPEGQTNSNGEYDSPIFLTTRKFKIADFWEETRNDNIIRATVERRNGKLYHLSKLFTFGEAGTEGSKYTLRMELTKPAGSNAIVKGHGFTVTAKVYDLSGNEVTGAGVVRYSWEVLNNCNLSNRSGASTSSFSATLNGNLPPLLKVTADINDPELEYNIYNVRGFMCTNGESGYNTLNVSCPSRVEYKSDGSRPIYDTSWFAVRETANNANEMLYPTWVLTQFAKSGSGYTQLNSSAVLYVGLSSLEVLIKESKLNTNVGSDKKATVETANEIPKRWQYRLDITKSMNVTAIDGRKGAYWQEEMVDKYITYIGFQYGNIIYNQVIAFAHNVYPSSLSNSWDGLLLLDAERNAVLARMLSAGVKNNLNRFSGVILGDWSDYGDSSIDPIGLYGFNNGELAFSFKTDGTGFIGKAGNGLIFFDGNNAIISNYDGNNYINLNPITFDLVKSGNNYSILYTNNPNGVRGSYSQYFLYSKNRKIQQADDGADAEVSTSESVSTDDPENYNGLKVTSATEADYGFVNTKWTEIFTKPDASGTEYSYFVVDPNNGVFMTGGLVADYGRIGDALSINSAGLTYEKNNGIIFIGQERTRDGKLITDNHTTTGYDHYYWSSMRGDRYNFDGDHPSNSTGRYIVWVGDTNSRNRPKYKYPNFGIEHDGTVHLNKAYVLGEIHASALFIGMPDGDYHDILSRFARTYYSKINPALPKKDGGVCNNLGDVPDPFYGDLLLEGDLWYDMSSTTNVKDISTFDIEVGGVIEVNKDTGDPTIITDPETGEEKYKYIDTSKEGSLDSTNPADFSTLNFKIEDLLELKDVRGYTCYEWRGKDYRTEHLIDAEGNTVYLTDEDGKPTSNPVITHDGWRKLPTLSLDTLTQLSTMADKSAEAINTLLKKLTRELNRSYDTIRRGMSPISFFGDGSCYISISRDNTTVDKIGSVPAGISIYQTDSSGTPNGSYMMLNGLRMGFYKKITSGSTTIDVPLLAYYNGNMGLAGSLAFGMDFSGVTNLSGKNDNITVYRNYLDGPNARLVLGSNLNSSDISDAAVYIDADIAHQNNDHWEPKIKLGALGGKAKISVAGFDLDANTFGNTSVTIRMKKPNDDNAANPPGDVKYEEWSVQDGDNLGTGTKKTIKIEYNVWKIEDLKSTYEPAALNYFKIVHEDRGILILENNANDVLFRPIRPNNSTGERILFDWDKIKATDLDAEHIHADAIFTTAIYLYSGSKAVELADKEWVKDLVYDVYSNLAGLISSALQTGNKAYGTAKHHSHNANGRVSNDGASWHA